MVYGDRAPWHWPFHKRKERADGRGMGRVGTGRVAVDRRDRLAGEFRVSRGWEKDRRSPSTGLVEGAFDLRDGDTVGAVVPSSRLESEVPNIRQVRMGQGATEKNSQTGESAQNGQDPVHTMSCHRAPSFLVVMIHWSHSFCVPETTPPAEGGMAKSRLNL